MSQRTDHAKAFKVKIMGADDTFAFNGKDFEQAVIHNTGTDDLFLRDDNDIDFVLETGVSFNLSTLPVKAINGLTVVTQASGACQIAYLQ